MTNEERVSLRNRRLLWPVPVSKSAQLFELPFDYALRTLVLDWIGEYTVGEFYMSHNVLYFCEEKDAMMYKLSDAGNKCKVFLKLKTEQKNYA